MLIFYSLRFGVSLYVDEEGWLFQYRLDTTKKESSSVHGPSLGEASEIENLSPEFIDDDGPGRSLWKAHLKAKFLNRYSGGRS